MKLPPIAFRPRLYRIGLVFLFAVSAGEAQEVISGTERLDSDRPEAWAMNYVTSVTLLAAFGVPRSRELGSVELGGELDWIPQLSDAQRRVGFNGTKEEDLNKAPVFGRPRVTLGLPGRFALTLSYLPPITIFGVKPNLFAFALERPLYESDSWNFGIRLYGQVGDVEGAFTCSAEVARFSPGSPQNPYGCGAKSHDKSSQSYGGLEFSGAYRIEQAGGLTPYLAVAGNFLDTEVRVNAETFGVADRRRLTSETWTFSLSAGLSYPVDDRLSLSIGMFYSPLRVTRPPANSSYDDGLVNVRALIAYRMW